MIYYAATKGTEAYKRLKEYHDARKDDRDTLEEYIKSLYPVPPKEMTVYRTLSEFRAIGACDPPPGVDVVWPKNVIGWWFRRNRNNKKHLDAVGSLRAADPKGWATALFGESRLTWYGDGVIRGISGGYVGDRLVVAFSDETHLEDYRDLPWPKGLRMVQKYTVDRWKATAAGEG